MKFTIKLSKWRTGDNGRHNTGEGPTRLLNSQGFMCCLGFACLAQGVKKVNIENITAPNTVSRNICKQLPGLSRAAKWKNEYYTTNFTDRAIEINDNLLTTVKEKMILLRKLCKKHGHQVRFVK